jgi:hypothetical protein
VTVGARGWARRARDGLSELFLFFMFLFYLPRRATNHLEKSHINRDLSSETVAKTALIKVFYRPQ